MSLSNKNTIVYASGISPAMAENEYRDLLKAYEEKGFVPLRLNIHGIAVDDSENLNHWQLAEEDMDDIAHGLVGLNIMKNHDSDNVDSVIGIIKKAEKTKSEEGHNQVEYWGEINDKNLIEKILLGYVKASSIQIAAPHMYCRNCFRNRGLALEEAGIENAEAPCPRCGEYQLYIKGAIPIEQSIVASPAYPRASALPESFTAAMNRFFASRFKANESKIFINSGSKTITTNEVSSAKGNRGNGSFSNPKLKNMSTAAPAGEISGGKGLDYEQGVEGFGKQLNEILKWIRMSYNLQLEESKARKRKAAIDRLKQSRVSASSRLRAEEEAQKSEEANEALKSEEDEAKKREEEARKHEDESRKMEEEVKKHKIEELRTRLEEARSKLEEAKAKREASAQTTKGNVGALSGTEGSIGTQQIIGAGLDNVPDSVKNYMAELSSFVASAKKQGLLEA